MAGIDHRRGIIDQNSGRSKLKFTPREPLADRWGVSLNCSELNIDSQKIQIISAWQK